MMNSKTVVTCLLWLSLSFMMAKSDPDLLQDFCVADQSSGSSVTVNGFVCKNPKDVVASDFLFRGLANAGSTNNAVGANVTAGNVGRFPGLNTLGISMNRVDFEPGGVNPPHVHPRATEIAFVLEGTLRVGFITTANVLFSQTLQKGDVFVFPKGLVHFQQNVGSSNALAITAFNSQNPGAQIIAPAVFGSNPAISEDVLTKAFQINSKQVEQIRSKFTS
eukprot:Gb_18427 [translate_table: standard]